MLARTVCALLVVVAGSSVGLAVQAGADQSRKADPSPASQVSTNPPTQTAAQQPAAPSIVVHTDATAKDARDSRVDVGGMKVSMASWSPACPVNPAAHDAEHGDVQPPAATRADGAIVIPDNTIGAGEPLWSVREREGAARKVAQAEADAASAEASRSPRDAYGYSYPGYTGYGWFGGLNTWGGGYGSRNYGLRGPVTTTVTGFDDLGSTAQRAYSNAAYPRNNANIDAQDRAQREFNRASTPPIGPTQNAVDRAHNEANHEHPRSPQSNQTQPRK